jgi:hypothetical protein
VRQRERERTQGKAASVNDDDPLAAAFVVIDDRVLAGLIPPFGQEALNIRERYRRRSSFARLALADMQHPDPVCCNDAYRRVSLVITRSWLT